MQEAPEDARPSLENGWSRAEMFVVDAIQQLRSGQDELKADVRDDLGRVEAKVEALDTKVDHIVEQAAKRERDQDQQINKNRLKLAVLLASGLVVGGAGAKALDLITKVVG
tara:strand:- start:549 stop:881 length:333 start_codon:yes stop_codon:yes gene_type:complete